MGYPHGQGSTGQGPADATGQWPAGQPPRRRRRRSPNMAVLSILVVLGVLIGGGAVLFGPDLVRRGMDRIDGSGPAAPKPGSEAPEAAQQAAGVFAAALEAGDLTPVAFATTSTSGAPSTTTTAPATSGSGPTTTAAGATVPDAYAKLTAGLKPFAVQTQLQPAVMVSATEAQAGIDLTFTFPDTTGTWATSSQVPLVNEGGEWRVRWTPSIIEPSLLRGDLLDRNRLTAPRAPILGRNGAVLVTQVDQVVVGIRPSRVQDLPTLSQTLARLIPGVDAAKVTASVTAAKPDDLVEVATLPKDRYDQLKVQLFPLPGTVFRSVSQPQAADDSFARALLGRSGPVTADIIKANLGLFQAGDVVGLSGLQGAYNAVLAGKPGLQITVKRAAGNTTTTTGAGLTTTSAIRDPNTPEELYRVDPVPGQPVVTTIDPVVQKAAEAALGRTTLNSSLVAIDSATGAVLAVANGPKGATVNNAMVGRYPPGSTFKVVSGYAVLRQSRGPNDSIDCPQNITIGGRNFGNAEDEQLGPIPFHVAFARSCNTAFVGATTGFGLSVLHDTALQFGLGVDYEVGADVFTGQVPVNTDKVDLAASAFGQGRLLVSPFSQAVMAATAAQGAFRAPQLVTSPAPPAAPTAPPLDPATAGTLQQLMREVVTSGTGTAALNVPGGPVQGKTGTAEFGNDNPPKTHAWFVGYQGKLAFAVLVEGGGFGGAVAAPIAAEFLGTLAGQGFSTQG